MSDFGFNPETEQYSKADQCNIEDRGPLADQYQVEILYRHSSHQVFVETLEEFFEKNSYGESSLTIFPEDTGFFIVKVPDGPRQCCAKYNHHTKENNEMLRQSNSKLKLELIDYKAALKAATQKVAQSNSAHPDTKKLEEEVARSEEQLAAANANLSVVKDESAAKSAQLEAAHAELAAMRDEVATLKKKLRPLPVLVSQVKSFSEELAAKSEELAVIKAVQAGAPTDDPLRSTQGGTSSALPTARAAAVKDQARCEVKAKQTGFEAIESLLGGLKGEAKAREAEIASLRAELGAEKEARTVGEEELAFVRSALGSTQDLVEDVRSRLTAAETALAKSARVGCSCSSVLRAARAVEAAAARTRPETPELVSGSSSDDGHESSDSVTSVGTDGVSTLSGEKKVWSMYTPPHLRRALRGESPK